MSDKLSPRLNASSSYEVRAVEKQSTIDPKTTWKTRSVFGSLVDRVVIGLGSLCGFENISKSISPQDTMNGILDNAGQIATCNKKGADGATNAAGRGCG